MLWDAGAQDNRKNEFHSLENIIIVVLFQLRKLMLCSAVEYGCERTHCGLGKPVVREVIEDCQQFSSFFLFSFVIRVLCSIGGVECTELR